MPTDLESIRKQALELTSSDRQELIHTLMASLESPDLTDVDNAWLDLAETRLQEIEDGQATISGDRFFADIRRERGW